MSALLVAALLAAGPGAPEAPSPSPSRPTVRTVAGKISEVTLSEGRVVLEAADGPVAVAVDRNTMVYLDSRFGTVRDLAVGLPARVSVGISGPAHWIEIRPRGLVPTPAVEPRAGAATAPAANATPPGPSAPAATPTPAPTPAADPAPAAAPAADAPAATPGAKP
jgi:hypothetical protein